MTGLVVSAGQIRVTNRQTQTENYVKRLWQ